MRRLVFLTCLLPATALAQIVKVKVEGNLRVSEKLIRSLVRTKEGDKKPEPIKIRKDIKSIMRLGFFEDVLVEVEEKNGEYTVIFKVKEKPLISRIEIEGRKKISEEDLKEKLFIEEGHFLDMTKIRRQEEEIEKLYKEEGYWMTTVRATTKRLPRNRVEVILKIDEGEGTRVGEIWLLGTEKLPPQEVEKYLATRGWGILNFIMGKDKFNPNKVEEDRDRAREAYLDWGYIDAKVEEPMVLIEPWSGRANVIFRISEGRRYKVGKLELSGDLIFEKGKLLSLLETERGSWFSKRKVVGDIKWLSDIYKGIGFADAEINPLMEIDRERAKIDLNLNIKRGSLFYIDKIEFSGNTKTRDRIVRVRVPTVEGEVFSLREIRKGQVELMATGFFENVSVVQNKVVGRKINVEYKVKEGRTGAISAGAGLASRLQMFLMFQGKFQNFLGYGQKFMLTAQLGRRILLFDAYFEDEHVMDTDFVLGMNAFKKAVNFMQFIKDTRGGGISLGYFVAEKTKAMGAGRIEDVQTLSVRTNKKFVQDIFGGGQARALRLSIIRDTRDHPFDTKKGTYTSGYLEFAGMFGGLEFWKLGTRFSWYHPLFWDVVFSQSLRLGFGSGFGGRRLPYPQRFFAGGIDTIRGYEYYSLGEKKPVPEDPSDPNTLVVDVATGGNKRAILNTEIIFPIIKVARLKGVIFFDAGQVYLEEEALDPLRFRTSWGFGIRWFFLPVAPLKLEWGFPIKRRSGERPVIFEFSLGGLM